MKKRIELKGCDILAAVARILIGHKVTELSEIENSMGDDIRSLKKGESITEINRTLLIMYGKKDEKPFALKVLRRVLSISDKYGIKNPADLLELALMGIEHENKFAGVPDNEEKDLIVLSTLNKGAVSLRTLTPAGRLALLEITKPLFEPRKMLTSPKDLRDTDVEVRNEDEYNRAREVYVSAGADIWWRHQGYKPRDPEEHEHHVYAWEDCGFLKLSGTIAASEGTFSSVEELEEVYKQLKRGRIVYV